MGLRKTSLVILAAFLALSGWVAPSRAGALPSPPVCERIVRADIVAFEQAYLLNRLGAYVPAGMMYALREDVVATEGSELRPGHVRLRSDKRPRPIVLRANEGDCLEIAFTNLLSHVQPVEGGVVVENEGRRPRPAAGPGASNAPGLAAAEKVSVDAPATRAASFHVTGLSVMQISDEDCKASGAHICGGDGSNVGLPERQGVYRPKQDAHVSATGSLALPGETTLTRWYAAREGAYFAYSMGAPVGGEGDGGQIGLGLFGAVNVEPKNAVWYRSQVTHEDLQAALKGGKGGAHPYASIRYDAERETPRGRRPILRMTIPGESALVAGKPTPVVKIVATDLNAIVALDERRAESAVCDGETYGTLCRHSFREFTVMFHDEIHAEQAFAELENEEAPLHSLRDGMGINYGASSMGSLVMSTPALAGTWPAKNCPECRAEEFFLSSWANGDPALLLAYDKDDKAIGARYRDDPSNVHHSYLGDPVRFRNLHAGPKETHVFHLHAHQWMQDESNPDSSYLDSQTISPGATFSYGIEFGGSGNRNHTPGDSIFHCHLYPHFAQGMWELWRVHDAFDDGKPGFFHADKPVSADNDPRAMNLPDPEIPEGTESPAVVPIPGTALAPMPTKAFRGYPFYIPGETGHRPPQPALDMDVIGDGAPLANEPAPEAIVDGGLPRHVVTAGRMVRSERARADAAKEGGRAAQLIARRVAREDRSAFDLAAEWEAITIKKVPESGTDDEKTAMLFHEGRLTTLPGAPQVNVPPSDSYGARPANWWDEKRAYRTAWAPTVEGQASRALKPALFFVNGQPRAHGAPYANPCPDGAPERDYRAAFIQTELTYNKHGWFDPQGRIVILENDIKSVIDPNNRTELPEPLFFRANSGECIVFRSSNFVPKALNADDFQIYTPTDAIGQHIHLVKFDVTSSDGSANGFNYEDATFSPGEVRERVVRHNIANPGDPWRLKAHPLFRKSGDIYEAAIGSAQTSASGGMSCGPIADGGGPLTDDDVLAHLDRIGDDTRCGNPGYRRLLRKGLCPARSDGEDNVAYLHRLNEHHPYCGAQRTVQRWWADPIFDDGRCETPGAPCKRPRKDNTLRTVFTHDHLGPSSHQQHGLYAGLVIEPANSVWARIGAPDGAQDPHAWTVAAGDWLKPENWLPSENPSRKTPNALACGAPAPNAPRLCDKLIGGSNLATKTSREVVNGPNRAEREIMPRAPLVLRSDGGPTATKANILAPNCIGDSDSNPVQPKTGRNDGRDVAQNPATCPDGRYTFDTRREFMLAIADFGIAYNAALEPINPEPRGHSVIRDDSNVRFGRRHVANALSQPLGISGEDPGSQYVNYRHEPLALRLSDATPSAAMGGWDYRQSTRRGTSAEPCRPENADCLGDPANGFSTPVHAQADEDLAKSRRRPILTDPARVGAAELAGAVIPNPQKLPLLVGDDPAGEREVLDVLGEVESWRHNFNCALYPVALVSEGCQPGLARLEPWRVFGDPATPLLPAYEGDPVQMRLIQGAQEAQHVFTMNGVKWRRLPGGQGHNDSGFVNAQPLGISEHFEFDLTMNPLGIRRADYLYFGSSVDQLWDGMWGVARSFRRPDDTTAPPYAPMAGERKPETFLSPLPVATARRVSPPDGDLNSLCDREKLAGKADGYRLFTISAVRVCDLYDNCGSDALRGIVYNARLNITDPKAMAFVEDAPPQACASDGDCVIRWGKASLRRNDDVKASLRAQYGSGRPLEPLVMRAAAGQCLYVQLRNLLPPDLDDGPPLDGDGKPREIAEARAYHNHLPMITDGFNINQFRMSSAVSLSAPRVAQNPVAGDGSNVGLNGLAKTVLPHPGPPTEFELRGTLVPPCRALPPDTPADVQADAELDCQSERTTWSLTDFPDNTPTEFGAIPLRSFGDPIKHPAHGLVGALVVGPKGSKTCDSDRFGGWRRPDTGQTEGRDYDRLSADICAATGEPLYVSHTLVLQDAVNAMRGDFPLANLKGAEEPDDYGAKAVNYKTEPLWGRTGFDDPSVDFSDRNNADQSQMLRSVSGDPETPVMSAVAGETVRLEIVHPGGHTRQQGLALAGHSWNPYPWRDDSHVFDASDRPGGSSARQGVFNAFGPMMGASLEIKAGGEAATPMDYLFRSQASFLFDGGVWGLLRVREDNGGEKKQP